MRKLISLALALVMILSLSTVAFADEAESTWNGTYTATDGFDFKINKTYTSDENWVPGETLEFEVAADGTENPDDPMITVGVEKNNKHTVTSLSNEITVNVPSYDTAGIYKYTIKEKEGSTAGVTYDKEKTIYVVILVEYDNTNHKLVIGNEEDDNGVTYYIKNTDGTKTDTFNNEFQTRDFTVEKDVIGNMANENDTFEITVTLTTDKTVLTDIKVASDTVQPDDWENGTYTKVLTISESNGPIAFNDIPCGVSVTVEETKTNGYTFKGYASAKSQNNTYEENDLTNSVSFKTNYDKETDKAVVVVNDKTTSVDTGISMDSVPYVLLLAVATLGLAVLFTKKRMMR